jgi:hypothetical protein
LRTIAKCAAFLHSQGAVEYAGGRMGVIINMQGAGVIINLQGARRVGFWEPDGCGFTLTAFAVKKVYCSGLLPRRATHCSRLFGDYI